MPTIAPVLRLDDELGTGTGGELLGVTGDGGGGTVDGIGGGGGGEAGGGGKSGLQLGRLFTCTSCPSLASAHVGPTGKSPHTLLSPDWGIMTMAFP